MFTKGQILVRIKPFLDSSLKVGDVVKFIELDEFSDKHMDVQVLKSSTAVGIRTCRISDFRLAKLIKRKQL